MSDLSSLTFEELLKLKEDVYNKTVLYRKQSAKTVHKRENKNRPREVSSKIKPKQIQTTKVEKHVARDPRFDPLCGEFDVKSFEENYKFIDKMRIKEKAKLEEELKAVNDLHKKKQIKQLIQRMDNKIREKEKLKKQRLKNHLERKEIKNKLKSGENPVYKKKSVKKMETLIEKYEELKKQNKLQKHIEKREKKLKRKRELVN